MDTYNWVSGPGVFIGSCILSGSLLSVGEVEGGTQVSYLAINVICIRTVILVFFIDPGALHLTPLFRSMPTRNPQLYANCFIQAS